MLERLNQEIKRRPMSSASFQTRRALCDSIRALAVEIHEDWIEAHRYLNMEMLGEQVSNFNSWRRPKVNATACSQTGCSSWAPAPELPPFRAPATATSPYRANKPPAPFFNSYLNLLLLNLTHTTLDNSVARPASALGDSRRVHPRVRAHDGQPGIHPVAPEWPAGRRAGTHRGGAAA